MYIDNIEDVTFWGMNIPKEMEKFMKLIENESIKNMTETELITYKMGVENTISVMKQILDQSDEANTNSITFYHCGIEETEEFLVDDIIKILNKRNEKFYNKLIK